MSEHLSLSDLLDKAFDNHQSAAPASGLLKDFAHGVAGLKRDDIDSEWAEILVNIITSHLPGFEGKNRHKNRGYAAIALATIAFNNPDLLRQSHFDQIKKADERDGLDRMSAIRNTFVLIGVFIDEAGKGFSISLKELEKRQRGTEPSQIGELTKKLMSQRFKPLRP